jgi:hypothetical protein
MKLLLLQFNQGFCPLPRLSETRGSSLYRFVKAAFRFSAKADMPSF